MLAKRKRYPAYTTGVGYAPPTEDNNDDSGIFDAALPVVEAIVEAAVDIAAAVVDSPSGFDGFGSGDSGGGGASGDFS